MSLCATGCPLPALLLAPFFREVFDSRSSFFAPNRTETLATQAVADRESSAALSHGVALKKKMNDRSRTERAVSLCATGWR